MGISLDVPHSFPALRYDAHTLHRRRRWSQITGKTKNSAGYDFDAGVTRPSKMIQKGHLFFRRSVQGTSRRRGGISRGGNLPPLMSAQAAPIKRFLSDI
jgi:hypothetical protein